MRLNEHLEHPDGLHDVFQHACKMGLEGKVFKRLGSRYRSGRSPDWVKLENPEAPAVKREAEEDWGKSLPSGPRGAAAEPKCFRRVLRERDAPDRSRIIAARRRALAGAWLP